MSCGPPGGQLTVRDVLGRLNEYRSQALAYNTVQTVMEILHRKEWLTRAKDGRAFRYRATKSREEYAASRRDRAGRAAYCLPGLGHRIVLTSATLAALESSALDAVIAHERAHIRGRHHLVLGYAQALVRALPPVALFRTAAAEMRRLVEMAADDEATRGAGRLTPAGCRTRIGRGSRTHALPGRGRRAGRTA